MAHEYRQKMAIHKPRIANEHKPHKIRIKHTYRIKAHTMKNQLLFTKVRTKMGASQIKRYATLRGFIPDRVTH